MAILSSRTRLLVVSSVAALAWFAGSNGHLAAQGGGGRGGAAQGGRGQGPARDAAQATVVGTAAISGTVVTEGAGTPVRRASVTLSATELRGGRTAVTDDQGRFAFLGLPAGRFSLSATKAGYVANAFGARRAGRPGTPIQLTDGQQLERLSVTLPRGSVITGIVLDEHGEPAPGTQVRALRYVLRTGERTLTQAGQDQTDDRGIYRIFQLQPGEYIVSAIPRNPTATGQNGALASQIEALVQQVAAGGGARGAGRGGLAGGGGGFIAGPAAAERIAALQAQLAGTEQQQSSAYAPVYYPGTSSIGGAASVTLGVGEERGSVDFQLQLVPTAKVEGIILSPTGDVPQGTQVALVPAETGVTFSVPGLGLNMSRVAAGGQFSFSNVTPGAYMLQARATVRNTDGTAPGPGGGGGRIGGPGGRGGGAIQQVLWASESLSIGGQDLAGIQLVLQSGMSVSGRVDFKRSTAQPPSDLTRVRVSLSPRGQQTFEIGGALPAVQADASGTFRINGVAPGRYAISAGINAGSGAAGGAPPPPPQLNPPAQGSWTLESAMAGGRDVLDFPLEIGPGDSAPSLALTFSDRTQELSGMIQDAAGRPTSDFTIVVFPTDSRYWLPQARRISSARPGTDGRFSFRGLPTGDYRLTAVTDAEPGEWYDPAFLAQLVPVSIPFSLAEGEKKVQDIKLAGGN